MNSPPSSVTLVRVIPVPSFVAVMFAPGTMAPLVSRTVPNSVAVVPCAFDVVAGSKTVTAVTPIRKAAVRRLLILTSEEFAGPTSSQTEDGQGRDRHIPSPARTRRNRHLRLTAVKRSRGFSEATRTRKSNLSGLAAAL